MIRHVVMFLFKDSDNGVRKSDNILKAKSLLEALPGKIPQIKYYQVGINQTKSSRAWDLALISDFDTENSMLEYQEHPEHMIVAEFIKTVRIDSHVVDFEI